MKKIIILLLLTTLCKAPPPKPPFQLQSEVVRNVLLPANRSRLRVIRIQLNSIGHQILATVRNEAGESETVRQERLQRLMVDYGKLMRRHRL